jgi:hypothetical protein
MLLRSEQGPCVPRGNNDWIRTPRQLKRRQHPKPSSTAINRRPHSLRLEPGRRVMAKQLSNFTTHWAYVRPPERSARLPLSGDRRMIAKLRELHTLLLLHPARTPGVAWGSTCLDRTCEQRP